MDDQEILAKYREWQIERGLSDDTIRCYRAVHRPFVAWLATRSLTLLTVNGPEIAEWVVGDGERCNRTRSMYVTRLTLLFRFMSDEGLRADVPTRRVAKPKFPRSVPRPLETADLYRALELADPRMALMLSLAAYAGLRRAEIAGLRREAIHDRDEPPFIVVRGKGDKERVIMLSPEITRALNAYGPPARGPLFLGRDAKRPLTPGYAGFLISQHLRACGIDATAHQGRHWFGTEFYRRSLDLRMTQDAMGHTSPATTAGYAAFSRDQASEVVNRLPARPRDDEPEEDEAA